MSTEHILIGIAVGAGGALGALARQLVTTAVGQFSGAVPLAVAIVNVTGCFAMGMSAGAIAAGQWSPSPPLRAFVFAGLLGGFTTFSSLASDTLTLVHEGRVLGGVLNVSLQVVLGLGAVFVGYAIQR